MSKRGRVIILGVTTVLTCAAVAFFPRIPQPLAYHSFADHRTFLGVPNFFDVVSNVPFLIVGLWGLVCVAMRAVGRDSAFIVPAERWPYVIPAAGVVMTCFGSAYYHLAPGNARLVWDRLPMTLGFMSLLSAMLMERVNLRAGLMALGPLLALGLASVVAWYASERRGAGDLRFYLVTQYYTLLLIILILWLFPPRYTRGGDWIVAMGFYVLAKVLEVSDRRIFSWGHILSGHTLKHLAAALGVYWIFRMLARRRPIKSLPEQLA